MSQVLYIYIIWYLLSIQVDRVTVLIYTSIILSH